MYNVVNILNNFNNLKLWKLQEADKGLKFQMGLIGNSQFLVKINIYQQPYPTLYEQKQLDADQQKLVKLINVIVA